MKTLYWVRNKNIYFQSIEEETDGAIKLYNRNRPIPKTAIDTCTPYYGNYYFSVESQAIDFANGKTASKQFNYQLLARMVGDCQYYIDARETPEHNHLWGKTPAAHIQKMYELYDSFNKDEKPMWLSRADIDMYARLMNAWGDLD